MAVHLEAERGLDSISNTLFLFLFSFFRGAFMRFGGEYCYECLFKVSGVNNMVPGLVIKQEEEEGKVSC